MFMESQEGRGIAAPLAHRVVKGAAAAQVADAAVAVWLEIATALAPIIGARGVAALYRRSLHLARPVHPWLATTLEGTEHTLDLVTLKSVLAQQPGTEALAAASCLLHTLQELLTSLVGPSLTERLLRPVWTHPSSAPPAQDITP
jgi:hypothetical protein